jgi:NADPH:quinone reductase-like Zn-dependent oxidoreductase
VLVKIAMCGTCGSDLKIYDRHFLLTLPYEALTPGHEWTGTGVALGDNVDEVAMGDRVLAWVSHVGIAPLSLSTQLRVSDWQWYDFYGRDCRRGG